MVRRFKIGDKVRILDCEYARNSKIVGLEGEIQEYRDFNDYQYKITLFGKDSENYELLADVEIEVVVNEEITTEEKENISNIKTTNFNIGDKVKVRDCEYGALHYTAGREGIIVESGRKGAFEYRVEYSNGGSDLYNESELECIDTEIDIEVKYEHPYISYSPTFNFNELPLGSLIHVDKGYLQLQGILTKVSLTELTIAYYDYESSSNVSRETVNIEDIVSGQQSFEIIREAISN